MLQDWLWLTLPSKAKDTNDFPKVGVEGIWNDKAQVGDGGRVYVCLQKCIDLCNHTA